MRLYDYIQKVKEKEKAETESLYKGKKKRSFRPVLMVVFLGIFLSGLGFYFVLPQINLPRITSPRIEKRIEKVVRGPKPPPKIQKFDPETLLTEANKALRIGAFEKAEKFLREYLKQHSDPKIMNDLGATLLYENKCKEAFKWFREALRKRDDPEVRLNLVLSLICLQDLERAKKEFYPLAKEPLTRSSAMALRKELERFFNF